MTLDQIVEETRQLPREQVAELVDRLTFELHDEPDWESVRRTGLIEIRRDHLAELEERVAAVNADPSIALSPAQARALLRQGPTNGASFSHA